MRKAEGLTLEKLRTAQALIEQNAVEPTAEDVAVIAEVLRLPFMVKVLAEAERDDGPSAV